MKVSVNEASTFFSHGFLSSKTKGKKNKSTTKGCNAPKIQIRLMQLSLTACLSVGEKEKKRVFKPVLR